MQQQFLTFEHPLNERMRTFLRTEFLFELAKYRYHNMSSEWDARDCITNIIELYNLIERTEFRSELLKELERNSNNFQRLASTPAVDHRALEKTISNLDAASDAVSQLTSRQGLFPKQSDLLQSIRQRLTVPGGTCSFDLPAFHFWLNLPVKIRQHYINQWIDIFSPLEKALYLVLGLIRQSGYTTKETASAGSFQETLNTQSTPQLLRVIVRSEYTVYPEISANKHRVNIRFLQGNFDVEKNLLAERDIPFELTCCSL